MPHFVGTIGLGVLALLVSVLLTPQVINFCHRSGVLDKPNSRKVHHRGMPRLGGVAIFSAASLGMILTATFPGILNLSTEQAAVIPWIYLGMAGFFMIGFADDIKSIPALPRLIAQFVVAFTVVVLSDGLICINSLFGSLILPDWLSVIVTVIWIVGVVNTFNWIDGLDGLSAGIGGISAIAFLVLVILKPDMPNASLTIILAIMLIGSVIGFLVYNFHPAKIFIGDGGAFSLGYLLAVISIVGLFKQAAVITFMLPVIILALPIGDTVFAIFRRLIRKQPITQADNKHIHHRVLALMSKSYRQRLPDEQRETIRDELRMDPAHRNAVLTLYAFAAVFAGIAIIVGVGQ